VGGDVLSGGSMRVCHSTQARTRLARGAAGGRRGNAARDASGSEDDGIPVAFTLEPLGTQAAPPIHEVVADLMRRVRLRSQS